MTSDNRRHVSIGRIENSRYTVTNARGGQITVGAATSGDADFTPVELLLAAIGCCTAIDADIVTSRRAGPERFDVDVDAETVRDDSGNHLKDITVTFRVAFGEGECGDAARAALPGIVRLSHDRLCTVGRTVELGTPITPVIEQ
jgi:uncharacterized OsmC-like protein